MSNSSASESPAARLLIDVEGMSDIDTTPTQQLGELLDDVDAAADRVWQHDGPTRRESPWG
jgi:hypothetical protein